MGFENPDLRALRFALRHGEVEPPKIGHEQRSARAGGSGDSSQRKKMAGILLANHREEPFATRNVKPFERGVVKQIVRVPHAVEPSHRFAGARIEDRDVRRLAATDEQPVPGLIERHRKVRLVCKRPLSDDGAFLAVDNGDVAGGGYVDEYMRSGTFQLKRFRVAFE